MNSLVSIRLTPTGQFSPLRYPGGKGKVAKFVRSIIRENGLSDGLYVEPYAGGASVAWELLCTGIVRRVAINDINEGLFNFWSSVIYETDEFCRKIQDSEVTIDQWKRQREIYKKPESHDPLEHGFSVFFLNRTNRSGILNAGVIGGMKQTGNWKLDARFNKETLIARIKKIAMYRSQIELFNLDACAFLQQEKVNWSHKTLVYLDPPYYEKGRLLYHDAYEPQDHNSISDEVQKLGPIPWIVSYDDTDPIHALYGKTSSLRYTLPYSAKNKVRGNEAMFFSDGLRVPEVPSPLLEIERHIKKA